MERPASRVSVPPRTSAEPPGPGTGPGADGAVLRATRAAATALAGPGLIVASGMWTLRDFWLSLRSTPADAVSFWLPMYTELGRRLGAGDLPAWTSSIAGGMPFAADPHSGWMQLLPMALFTWFGPATALAWLITLQPVIAGLGMYAFVRTERLSRPAAAVAGLMLTMAIATARLALTIRFAGVMAWTVVALACAARLMRARRWDARLGWTLATALAWGQVAGAHLTAGGAIGGGALAAYVAAAGIRAVRRGDASRRTVLTIAGLLVGALVVVNLAILLPRAAIVSRTSLAGGYDEIARRSLELTGQTSPHYPGQTGSPTWPLNLATVPGAYLGAGGLVLAGSALWSRRHRTLAAGFAAFGLVAYVATLGVTARLVERTLGGLPLVDQYLHGPEWLCIGVLISIAALAAIGVDAWREEHGGSQRWLRLVPGGVVWLALPAVWGAGVATVPALVGAAALAAILALGLRRAAWLVAIPVLVLVELFAPFVIERGRDLDSRLPPIRRGLEILYRAQDRVVDLRAYVAPGPIALALEGEEGRVLAIGRRTGAPTRTVATLANNEAELYGLGLEATGTYRAVQLDRYWTLLRAVHREPIRYNRANVNRPDPRFLDLLAVEWIVATRQPEGTVGPVEVQKPFGLFHLPDAAPRASVLGSWTVVEDRAAALEAFLEPGFDPSSTAVVESPGGSVDASTGDPGPVGEADYRAFGPEHVRVDVRARRAGLLVIRNAWDPYWSATVDGREAEVVPVDSFAQGVFVPKGASTVELTYDDPWVGWGVAGSAAGILGLAGTAGALAVVRRRRDASA